MACKETTSAAAEAAADSPARCARSDGLLADEPAGPETTRGQDGALYRQRWGIEVFYRSCKQTLERRRCLSRTPETCQAEVQWLLLGVWLLGLMTGRVQIE